MKNPWISAIFLTLCCIEMAHAQAITGVLPGRGFDTEASEFRSATCVERVDGAPLAWPEPSEPSEQGGWGPVNVTWGESADSLASSLGASFSVRYGKGPFKGSSTTALFQRMARNSYSFWLRVRAEKKFLPILVELRHLKLTEGARSLANNPMLFRLLCGDSFTTGATPGLVFDVVYDMHSDSQSDISSLKSRLMASGWGADAAGSIDLSFEESHRRLDLQYEILSAGVSGPMPKNPGEMISFAHTLDSRAAKTIAPVSYTHVSYKMLPDYQSAAAGDGNLPPTDLSAATKYYSTVYDRLSALKEVREDVKNGGKRFGQVPIDRLDKELAELTDEFLRIDPLLDRCYLSATDQKAIATCESSLSEIMKSKAIINSRQVRPAQRYAINPFDLSEQETGFHPTESKRWVVEFVGSFNHFDDTPPQTIVIGPGTPVGFHELIAYDQAGGKRNGNIQPKAICELETRTSLRYRVLGPNGRGQIGVFGPGPKPELLYYEPIYPLIVACVYSANH